MNLCWATLADCTSYPDPFWTYRQAGIDISTPVPYTSPRSETAGFPSLGLPQRHRMHNIGRTGHPHVVTSSLGTQPVYRPTIIFFVEVNVFTLSDITA